jgi:hypothetical protein
MSANFVRQNRDSIAGLFYLKGGAAFVNYVVGGQVGCDLQFDRNWVIGAQVDGAWTHLNGGKLFTGSQSVDANGGHFDVTGNLVINANVISTATGRIVAPLLSSRLNPRNCPLALLSAKAPPSWPPK